MSLAGPLILLALALGIAGLLLAAMDRLPPKLLLQALFLLQLVLLVQAGLAFTRLDGWDGSVGELVGYLAVSALLVPGGLILAVEERSRYGTLVLAVACLVVAVVELRLVAVWSAGD